MIIDKIMELLLYLDYNIKSVIIKHFNSFLKKNKIKCFFKKTFFLGIIKNFQDDKINVILNLLKTNEEPEIITYILESFLMLNDNNFDIIFNNYKNYIKSQNYNLFFYSISKIKSKQEFLINDWFDNYNINDNQESQLNILQKISSNIYKIELINNLLLKIKNIYSNKYKLTFDKIIDILNTNLIISKNINY
jgi:hypothetical protein